MKTLDLTGTSSEIDFKITKFPDGQQTLEIQTIEIEKSDIKEDVFIHSRLNNFSDLELILCATAALKNLNTPNIHLYVPYFIGARSDRKFNGGGINYLKDVIAPIINSQGYKSVTVLDPHSDVLEAVINNFRKISNVNLVKWALDDICKNNEKVILVSPDAGALKKVYNIAAETGNKNVIVANKHRDIKTGNITHTSLIGLSEHDNGCYVIIDDICDGGRTFIELAKIIHDKVPQRIDNINIYLIVTHGIFSAGFTELSKYFDCIYTTNSYSDINLHKLNNVFTNKSEYHIPNVKQLNIF